MPRSWLQFPSASYDPNTTPGDLQITSGETVLSWISPQIDIADVLDAASGAVTADTTLGAGSITLLSRSATGPIPINTDWTAVLPDGTIQTTTGDRVQIQVILRNGAVLHSLTIRYDGEPVAAVLKTGLTDGAEYTFTQFRGVLIIANATDAPLKWEGDPAVVPSALGGSPPVFSMVATHLNRVWGIEAGSSRLRYSDILNEAVWPALNFFDFNPEDGDEVTTLYRFGPNLIVSKYRAVALLVGDRSANFSISWLDHGMGATGPHAVETMDRLFAYVARDGIRVSDLTQTFLVSESHASPAHSGADGSWEADINPRRLNQAAMVYWKQFLLVALPKTGELHNGVVWVYDTVERAWSRISGWKVSRWLKFRQYGEEVLLAGDSLTGQIYQVLTGDTDLGNLVEFDWIGPSDNFGHADRYKVFPRHTITVEGAAASRALQVYYRLSGGVDVDGNEVPAETEFTADPITVPAGDGVVRTYLLIPPAHGATIGRSLAIRVVTSLHVYEMSVEFVVRGRVPGGLV